MDTLGERLNYARKKNGYTQDSLASAIGVSRGVIFNLEKNKTEPQAIVIYAICSTLKIKKDWLVNGEGEMEETIDTSQSAKVLAELYNIAKAAKEIGLDMFVLDDGWFGKRNTDYSGLGDWVVNEDKIKGGLPQLVKRIKDLDMKFGIWIEP